MDKKPNNIPSTAGVYFFKKGKTIIYIGKAKNLKGRIASYFSKQNADVRKTHMMQEATTVTWKEVLSDAEALIREAEYIKKHKPTYNIVMRDDKQYFYVRFSHDDLPRIFLTHQPRKTQSEKRKAKSEFLGPFTDGASLKQTLKMLRRAFPYCTCKGMHKRKCQNAMIGRCLGICCTDIPKLKTQSSKFKTSVAQYKKNMRVINNVLSGKGKAIMQKLEKEMALYSQKKQYEKAAEARDQLYALENIFSHRHTLKREEDVYAQKGVAYLARVLKIKKSPKRIEAYDISHIQGKDATGAMVVFTDGKPDKKEYRKFSIRLPARPNDTAMMKEMLMRRLHNNWPLPDVMVIDGGKGQRNAAENALRKFQITKFKLQTNAEYKISNSNIAIIALAKREEELYLSDGKIIKLKEGPQPLLHLLQYIRNEAHRFAIHFHRTKRNVL